MSLDGALFDIEKIKSISKNVLSKMDKKTFTDRALDYALKYEQKLADIIQKDRDYFESIINIGREQKKPRKDYEKYSDVFDIVSFMYDQYYEELIKHISFDERFNTSLIIDILNEYIQETGLDLDQNEWFEKMKNKAVKRGFAARPKDYKKNPDDYIGHVGDYAEIIRIAACGKANTPNFYDILQILGESRVIARIEFALKNL
jgi:glutamyl-tRNA synthetase